MRWHLVPNPSTCKIPPNPMDSSAEEIMGFKMLRLMLFPRHSRNGLSGIACGSVTGKPCKRIISDVLIRRPRFVSQWPCHRFLVKQGEALYSALSRPALLSISDTHGSRNGSQPLASSRLNTRMRFALATLWLGGGRSAQLGLPWRASKKLSNGDGGDMGGNANVPVSLALQMPTK